MTKKQRKRKKKQQLKNKKLLKRYPWLTPRNRWTGKIPKDYDYTYTELDDMPRGWRKAFGMIMVDEIDKELRKYNAQDTYRIMQIKEKFGQLRWYDGGQPRGSKIDEIISKYEYISEGVCINCGKPDAPMTDIGWISPRCFDCYIKYYRHSEKFKIEQDPEYIPKTKDEIKEIYEKDIISEPNENGEYRIRDTYSIIRFSKDGNKTITYDISDTVEKIRRKYGKRTS